MAGPWEKYASQTAEGPWSKYAATESPTYNQYTGGKTPEQARREFIRQEKGNKTLGEKVGGALESLNEGLEYVQNNIKQEPFRLAQEMVTVPINSAINLARTTYGRTQEEPYDVSRQAAADMHVKGPLEPSMTGKLVSAGIEKGSRSLRDLGVDQTTIDAALDVTGLVGGGKVLAKGGRSLANIGKEATGRVIGQLPEKLYASALKQKVDIPMEQRAANVKTGLEGGYAPSSKGLEKLYTNIDEVNRQIGDVVKTSATTGGKVSVGAIARQLDDVRQRAVDSFGDNNSVLAKLDDFEASLRSHPAVINGELPVDVAQRMKTNTYKELKKAYGELKGYEIEAKKAMARGAKEELVSVIPELAELNAKDSALINLEKVLFKAANRIENRDLVGIGVPIKMAATAAAGPKGSWLVGLGSGIVDAPAVKANLALALHKARKRTGQRSTISSAKIDAGRILATLAAQRDQSEQITP